MLSILQCTDNDVDDDDDDDDDDDVKLGHLLHTPLILQSLIGRNHSKINELYC